MVRSVLVANNYATQCAVRRSRVDSYLLLRATSMLDPTVIPKSKVTLLPRMLVNIGWFVEMHIKLVKQSVALRQLHVDDVVRIQFAHE